MTTCTLPGAILAIVSEARTLTESEAEEVMALILNGDATPVQIAALLTALKVRGETVEEITGFARAMRAASEKLDVPGPLLDTCGTGGGGLNTFNISTAAAIVIAAAGVRVAKHGNRAITSQTGSVDVLEVLGVDTSQPAGSLARHGIGFLYAPAFHPAMRYAQPIRKELKFATVFNMLGPLTNPARANSQIVGAFSKIAAGKMAHALAALGLERGFVFHGADGLDEVSTTGDTTVFAIDRGTVTERVYTPEDFGVARARKEDLAGGDAETNAGILRDVMAGTEGPRRDIVLVNAALGLVAAGHSSDVRDGMLAAARAVDSGAAQAKLSAISSGSF